MDAPHPGVDTPVASTLHPRQSKFIGFYLDIDSPTFGNCYQSALKAGYTHETARNLTHNRPMWLSEKLGMVEAIEPQFLLIKLTLLINDPGENSTQKLRAIELLMKYYQMFPSPNLTVAVPVTIQSILE